MLTRPPLAGLSASAELRSSFGLSANRERLIPPATTETSSDLPETSPDWGLAASRDESGSVRRTQWQTRGGGAPGTLAESASWDQSRPIYNPRGAPSDGVPALTKLEARIAMEPNYIHHYASTRYASVSYMPWTLAERRQRIDIMA